MSREHQREEIGVGEESSEAVDFDGLAQRGALDVVDEQRVVAQRDLVLELQPLAGQRAQLRVRHLQLRLERRDAPPQLLHLLHQPAPHTRSTGYRDTAPKEHSELPAIPYFSC